MQAARIDEVVMRGLDPRIHRLGKSIAKRRKALATAGWTAGLGLPIGSVGLVLGYLVFLRRDLPAGS